MKNALPIAAILAVACQSSAPAGSVDASVPMDAPADHSPVIPEGGPPGDATSGYLPALEIISGTRLKGFYVMASNGAHDQWMWDSVLGTRCDYRRAEGDSFRCLPHFEIRTQLDGVETVYRDADCTEPLFPENSDCAAAYGYRKVGAGYAVFMLGPAEVPARAYRSTDAGCVPVAGTLTRRYHTAGASLPPSMFVRNTGLQRIGEPGQRIRPSFNTYEDGSGEPFGSFEDTMLNLSCNVLVAADGVPRCLPANYGLGPFYGDDQCTRRVGGSSMDRAYHYVTFLEGVECQQRFVNRVYELGASVPDDHVFQKTRAGCVPYVKGNTNIAFFEPGPEAPADRFAPFREVTGPAGRIQGRYYVNDDGVARRTEQTDSQTGFRCTFMRTAKGWRCLPPEGAFGSYADAACTVSTGLSFGGTGCDGQQHTYPSSARVGPWCQGLYTPGMAGQAVASTFNHPADGPCTATGRPGLAFTPMDPAAFEPGEELIR